MKGIYYLISISFLLVVCLLSLSSNIAERKIVAFNSNAVKTVLGRFLGCENGERRIATTTSSPLKIFVMVGQSNTDGHGYVNKTNESDGSYLPGTLEALVATNTDTYGMLKTFDETGNSVWKERGDVFITYNRQSIEDIRPEWNKFGPLAAGYGYGDGDHMEMGPELGFGWTIGDALGSNAAADQPSVLLLKCSWGGRSLAVNYRPPSSGGTTGLFYEAMLANVYKTLANLPTLVPGYTEERGYEIAGFAWHQGWNDGCNDTMTLEYESNLANLIRDIRVDLGVPDLPVSIGVSGMNGWQPRDSRRTAIVEAQMVVSNPQQYPEFAGTVASVETRDFFREVKDSPGDQIYHWNNNCESYWLIGRAMGQAMLKLLQNKEKNYASGDDKKHVKGAWKLRNFGTVNAEKEDTGMIVPRKMEVQGTFLQH